MAGLMDVPHLMQQEEWDCGLACAKMILQYCGIQGESDDRVNTACQQIGIKEAVWTIDLAHLMTLFGVKHDFYTVTFGVDPSYNTVGFYTSERFSFSEEQMRINELFKTAAEKGISAAKRSLDREEILRRLKEGHPAIVLIDASILSCQTCDSKMSLDCCNPVCLQSDDDEGVEDTEHGYAGHFIVACGYNQEKEQIFYKNPARNVDLCCCSFDNFDSARKSHGTDEDILFIHR